MSEIQLTKPVVVGLPIADRKTSHEFYSEGLGLAAVGAPAEDGIPEPLQIAVNDGLMLMLIPRAGFGWVIGGRKVAEPAQSECVITLSVGSRAEVDNVLMLAEKAGAHIVAAAAEQPWGYTGTFSDPDGHLFMVDVAG